MTVNGDLRGRMKMRAGHALGNSSDLIVPPKLDILGAQAVSSYFLLLHLIIFPDPLAKSWSGRESFSPLTSVLKWKGWFGERGGGALQVVGPPEGFHCSPFVHTVSPEPSHFPVLTSLAGRGPYTQSASLSFQYSSLKDSFICSACTFQCTSPCLW